MMIAVEKPWLIYICENTLLDTWMGGDGMAIIDISVASLTTEDSDLWWIYN